MGRLVLSRNDMLALMSQLIVWKQDWPDIWLWGSYEKSFAGLCPQLTIVMRDHFFANTGIFCVFDFSRKSLTLFDPSADKKMNNLTIKDKAFQHFLPHHIIVWQVVGGHVGEDWNVTLPENLKKLNQQSVLEINILKPCMWRKKN